jgi:hypothetical protein
LLWNPSQAVAQSTKSSAAGDTVHGRVIADTVALAKAAIRVIALPDSESHTTTTDARGEFSVAFDKPAASYLVTASLIGYARDTLRVPRPPRVPPGIRLSVTVRMRRAVQTLSRVQTTAKRPRPPRDLMGDTPGPGETGAVVDPAAILNGDMTGDLTALLGMVPGLDVTPGADGSAASISIAGLSSDQNSVALNGLNSNATMPRDGAFVRIVTSSYDPSRGGFSGIQSNYIVPGGAASTKRLHASLEAPALQWTTPAADRLGQRYTQPIVSGTLGSTIGPTRRDPRTQSTSFQFSRRTSDLVSLTSANGASLAAIGVAPDSVARLLETLAQLGIPASVHALPSERVSTSGSFLTRVDLSHGTTTSLYTSDPDGRGLTHGSGTRPGISAQDFYILVGGGLTDDQAQSITPTSLPSHGGDARSANGMIQANGALDIGVVVNEYSTGLTASSSHSSPYLDLPGASVLLQSQLPNGTNAYSTLQAAGSSAGPSTSTNWSWNALDKIKWDTFDGAHQFQISLDGTLDHYALTQTPGAGTYFYNSLNDFAANAPASFSRTLGTAASHGEGLRGALGLSDIHTMSPSLVAQYGLRVEDNSFVDRPDFNQLVASQLGLRTDHVPSTLTVAPMAGFTWSYAQLPNGRPDTRRQLAGGIRDWRGVLSTRSLDPYLRQTGLDVTSEQLQCVGAAVPIPDWSTFTASSASIPDACADGVGNASFVTTSPGISVFAPNYVPSHSVRADLTWTDAIGSLVSVSLHGLEAINTNMPELFDANFAGQRRFSLNDEGGRPVYVQPGSIVPGTGVVGASDSRVTSQFGAVDERRSDAQAHSSSVTAFLNLHPTYNSSLPAPSAAMTVAYTYSATRSFMNGFATTDGDPTMREWSASPASRHTVIVSGLLRVPTWATFSASVVTRSGVAFTPRVASDINGDGYADDRAFVFDPATASDPTLAAAMRTLLASAPSGARDCLRRQLGSIAGMNSCSGPWTTNLNLRAGLDAYRLGFKNHGSINLIVMNALGAADQLLHGADRLHGWGQPAFPDATLLEARGFDPSARRFIYNVNPQFGSTTLSRAGYRAPFSLVLDARFDFGRDFERSNLEIFLRPVVDSGHTDVEGLKSRLRRIVMQGPMDALFSDATGFGLNSDQIGALHAAADRYGRVRDSTYADLAAYLSGVKKGYDMGEVDAVWHRATSHVMYAQGDLGDAIRSTLTPAQYERAVATRAIGFDYVTYSRAMLNRRAQQRFLAPP